MGVFGIIGRDIKNKIINSKLMEEVIDETVSKTADSAHEQIQNNATLGMGLNIIGGLLAIGLSVMIFKDSNVASAAIGEVATGVTNIIFVGDSSMNALVEILKPR